jgi:cold-inducible RNA-binding protein
MIPSNNTSWIPAPPQHHQQQQQYQPHLSMQHNGGGHQTLPYQPLSSPYVSHGGIGTTAADTFVYASNANQSNDREYPSYVSATGSPPFPIQTHAQQCGPGVVGGEPTYYFAQHQHAGQSTDSMGGSMHGSQTFVMGPPAQSSGVTFSSLLSQPPQGSNVLQQGPVGIPRGGGYVVLQQLPPQTSQHHAHPHLTGPPPPSPPIVHYTSSVGAQPQSNSQHHQQFIHHQMGSQQQPPINTPMQYIFTSQSSGGSGSNFLVTTDNGGSGHMQHHVQPSSAVPQYPQQQHFQHQQQQQQVFLTSYPQQAPQQQQQNMFSVQHGISTAPSGTLIPTGMAPPPPPPPPPYTAQAHHFIYQTNDSSTGDHSQGQSQQNVVKKTKRSKKKKQVLLTPRSQAIKEKEAREREEEKANRGGRPYAEDPFELDTNKKQLIVNFLSHAVTETEFSQIFSQFGQLSASRIIYDKHTNRSKGYGFVYFKRGEDAVKAILDLNGMEVHAKAIKVSYASPQRPTPPSSPREGAEEAHESDEGDATSSSGADDDDDEVHVDGDITADGREQSSCCMGLPS